MSKLADLIERIISLEVELSRGENKREESSLVVNTSIDDSIENLEEQLKSMDSRLAEQETLILRIIGILYRLESLTTKLNDGTTKLQKMLDKE